ncbi:MAG: type III pantothenate kinase [Dehalococcoidia bacterium]|nr:type III pantothenate kinase [Dehalococcoidia bacterium]
MTTDAAAGDSGNPTEEQADGLLLAIDIGNTSIAIGVFDQQEIVGTFRIATDQENFPDEYAMLLLGLLRTVDIEPDGIAAAVMSSTVPPLVNTFQQVCRKHFHVEPLVVGPGVRTGIRVLYDNPREVGPDRILHAVAALDSYDPPLIIVDLGTACVFDAVSRDGDYLGGAIAPGIGLASQALFSRAAMLHRVSLEHPAGPIGRNTVHSMQSGIFFGYVEMVRGMVRRFKAEVGEEALVIGTGGYSAVFAEEAACFDALEPDLNLTGLRLVYEANQ